MRPAAQLASFVLDAFKVESKPDLALLCREFGLRVKEVDSTGFDGALVCSVGSQKGIIALRRSIREASRKRFTVAHEIGHFVIPYHRRLKNVCESMVVERFGKELGQPEIEANEFAAELLLPNRVVRSRFNLKEPNLVGIGEVAHEFETSLTATTYRYLDLTDLPCAMVWSEANKALWYHTSDAFPFYLPYSELPMSGSIAGRLFARVSVESGPHTVPAELWLDGRDAESVQIMVEDSVRLPSYNAVLSFLWIVKMDAIVAKSRGSDDELLPELDPQDFTLRRKRWPR